MRKKDEIKTIHFFAKVGNLSEKPYGGGEVGNRRTIELLEELGYDLKLVPRYYNYKRKNLIVYLSMIIGDVISLFHLFFHLVCKKRKNAVVHISGFTGVYLPIEFIAILISKITGFITVYEIRGGGIIGFYEKGSFVYKWMLKCALSCSDYVFSQGFENKELFNKISSTPFFYYPNYVKDDFMPESCPSKDTKIISLIYLGRVSPSKNVLLILETVKIMIDSGYNVELNIIGGADDFPEYMEECKNYALSKKMDEKCNFLGKMGKEQMKPYLLKSLFFIFPTIEKREGQSNSLTEVMSFGVIPIASSQGYTKSIVGCKELIVDTLTAEAYSEKIIEIYTSNNLSFYTQKMYDRIKDSFTYSIIKQQVDKEYKNIFEKA